MLIGNLNDLTGPSSNVTEKNHQNYVPFISKSPRFQDKKSSDSSAILPCIHIANTKQIQNIKNQIAKRQLKNDKPPQYFFKSNLNRFAENISLNTPSPAQYDIIKPKSISKQAQKQNRSLPKYLPTIKTVPTIPDNRNKFGYNIQGQQLDLVEKSIQQLERERVLMKQYKKTLIDETIKISKGPSETSTPAFKQPNQHELKKKLREVLHSQESMQKLENIAKSKKLYTEIKPKYSHLYQYFPEIAKQKIISRPKRIEPIYDHPIKKQKFQFFNSSEKRFKTQDTIPLKKTEKASVRNYLSKLINANYIAN